VNPIVRRGAHWKAWLSGMILLGAVVTVALHFSEGHEFIRLAERAEPWWLTVAVLLQAGTYLVQSQIWRTVAHAARFPLSLSFAYRLSLAKLFVDQALPTGGISGTVIVAKTLEDRGMPRAAVMGGVVVVNTAAYYAAYVLNLIMALAVTAIHHRLNGLIVVTTLLFVAFSIGFAVVLLVLSGRDEGRVGMFGRVQPLARILRFLQEAQPHLARDPRLLLKALAWHIVIFWLDAVTVWVSILAIGGTAPVGGVFASYMIASVFRSIGVLPGGLGTFEAAAVLTLNLVGVSIPVALAATLIFRGLSFWLPMLPGLWFSRGVLTNAPATH
jgi:Mg2+-importing ATPase